MRAVLCGLVFAMAQATAHAGQVGSGPLINWQAKQPTRFMVSGILRKEGSADAIRPVHGLFDAQTDREAARLFQDEIGQRFKGYVLVAVLVDPVPPDGRCENR